MNNQLREVVASNQQLEQKRQSGTEILLSSKFFSKSPQKYQKPGVHQKKASIINQYQQNAQKMRLASTQIGGKPGGNSTSNLTAGGISPLKLTLAQQTTSNAGSQSMNQGVYPKSRGERKTQMQIYGMPQQNGRFNSNTKSSSQSTLQQQRHQRKISTLNQQFGVPQSQSGQLQQQQVSNKRKTGIQSNLGLQTSNKGHKKGIASSQIMGYGAIGTLPQAKGSVAHTRSDSLQAKRDLTSKGLNQTSGSHLGIIAETSENQLALTQKQIELELSNPLSKKVEGYNQQPHSSNSQSYNMKRPKRGTAGKLAGNLSGLDESPEQKIDRKSFIKKLAVKREIDGIKSAYLGNTNHQTGAHKTVTQGFNPSAKDEKHISLDKRSQSRPSANERIQDKVTTGKDPETQDSHAELISGKNNVLFDKKKKIMHLNLQGQEYSQTPGAANKPMEGDNTYYNNKQAHHRKTGTHSSKEAIQLAEVKEQPAHKSAQKSLDFGVLGTNYNIQRQDSNKSNKKRQVSSDASVKPAKNFLQTPAQESDQQQPYQQEQKKKTPNNNADPRSFSEGRTSAAQLYQNTKNELAEKPTVPAVIPPTDLPDQTAYISENKEPKYYKGGSIPPVNVIKSIDVSSRIGYIPNTQKKNQDNFIIEQNLGGLKDCWMLGVLDGHGQNGHLVSEFIKTNMPRILEQKIKSEGKGQKRSKSKDKQEGLPPLAQQSSEANWMINDQEHRNKIIAESFVDSHDAIKGRILADFSGTTCVMVYIWNDLFVCANAGDSRAIIFLKHKIRGWECTPLSRDHKPSERDEAFRVRCENGRIEPSRLKPGMCHPSQVGEFFGPLRVWLKEKQLPGLAMTRSIGDFVATDVGVCPDPEFQELPINKIKEAEEGYLVVASDGIWDRFSDEEIMNFIIKYKGDCQKATNDLVEEAQEKWMTTQQMIDDITLIVAQLNLPLSKAKAKLASPQRKKQQQ